LRQSATEARFAGWGNGDEADDPNGTVRDGAIMKRLSTGLVVSVALVLPATADIVNTQFAKVTKVNDYGVMVFEERNPTRLWGIVVTEPRTLRQLVVGKEIACEFAEAYQPWIIGAKCRLGGFKDPVDLDTEDLSEFLIEKGAAFEFCAESRNYYGTCDGLANDHSHKHKGELELACKM
jgi:hypothetical protein